MPLPGQAGDDDEPVARERDVDVLEVVFARAAHDELILGHVTSLADMGHIEHVFRLAPLGTEQVPSALGAARAWASRGGQDRNR